MIYTARGLAKEINVTAQAIYDAIKRGDLEAVQLVVDGMVQNVGITEQSAKRYAKKKGKELPKQEANVLVWDQKLISETIKQLATESAAASDGLYSLL